MNTKSALETLLAFSIARRLFILFVVLSCVVMGAWRYTQLPIDAVPDITNVQVQINTEAQGYSPLEAEQRITWPIETALAGLPHLSYTRSLSRYGLSQVTVVFDDGTDIYFARNLINERLSNIKNQLPAGLEPAMGPLATGLGEIFMYTVEANEGAPIDAMTLRELQDWVIRPQLMQVKGVVKLTRLAATRGSITSHLNPPNCCNGG